MMHIFVNFFLIMVNHLRINCLCEEILCLEKTGSFA
jgi:hypothetical protein